MVGFLAVKELNDKQHALKNTQVSKKSLLSNFQTVDGDHIDHILSGPLWVMKHSRN